MKLPKSKHLESHTSRTKMGMGDYYGTGITAKIGRQRGGGIEVPVPTKKLRNPPKSVA